MSYQDIITIEPDKRSGKPCIRGMRITVQDILKMLASDMTHDEIIDEVPAAQGHPGRAEERTGEHAGHPPHHVRRH